MMTFRKFFGYVLGLTFFMGLSGVALAGTGKITAKEAFEKASKGEIVLIDIREPVEWKTTGVAPVAKTLAMRDPRFLQKLKQLKLAFAGKKIALICAHGNRSRYVQKALVSHGYPDIIDVKKGMESAGGWLKSGLPTKKWSGK